MPPSSRSPVLFSTSGSRAETSKLMWTGAFFSSMNYISFFTLLNYLIFLSWMIFFSASSICPLTPTRLTRSNPRVFTFIREAQCSFSSPVQTASALPWVLPVFEDLYVFRSGYAPIQITCKSGNFLREAKTEDDAIDRSPPSKRGLFILSRVW